jgi:hypothetical protein
MSITKYLNKLFIGVYVFRRLIKLELAHKRYVSLPVATRMWVNGFFSKSYILYNLKENNLADYLSDIQENLYSKWIIADKQYMDDKLIFPKVIRPFAQVPEDIGIIVRGKLCSISLSEKYLTIDNICNILSAEKNLILKPIDGASGDGIVRLEFINNAILWNGIEIDRHSFATRIYQLHNYLISKFIIQADYASTFYSRTVNTIRILTMINPDTNQAFIAAVAHRIGTSQSFPVDNCAAGGLTANIDIETGRMGKGVSTKINSDSLTWHTHHPDTKSPIEGEIIPGWQQLKKDVLDMSNNLSFIPYIGWDIVITNTGFTVIEGNDGPDIKLHQVHKPLLVNPEIKQFYKYHHII